MKDKNSTQITDLYSQVIELINGGHDENPSYWVV